VDELQKQIAERDAKLQDLEKVKGWQASFTRASQAGLGEFVNEVLKGRPLAEVKAEIETMRQTQEWLKGAGGKEALQPFVDILNEPGPGGPTAQPTPTAAPSAQAGMTVAQPNQKFITAEELPALFQQWQGQQQGEQLATTLATTIAQESGIVKAGETPAAPVLKAIRRQNDAFLEDIVGVDVAGKWLREPTTEDLQAAAAQTRSLYLKARAGGLIPQGGATGPAVPPLANAGGPGAQVPAKPPQQMTHEELRAAAQERIRQTLAARPGRVPVADLPAGMTFE
jgi:hypothetical protein